MSAPPSPLPPDQGFNGLIGLQDLAQGDDGTVTATVPVRPELLQPFGLVHGGVFASVAETLASFGTFVGVHEQGMHAMGLSNSTSFLRPIVAGTIHATARPFHRGRTTWLWDVEITDDDGRLCATTRMTIAVRPARRA
ncbi:MAG TPA: PaaI family thioesterase [Polyangiales bacterium]|nr:PaaI family thioesterase [Polyangiales bacterium]